MAAALAGGVERRSGDDAYECQVVPSGPGFDGENNLRLFNALVYGAQERLIIASPYFVPDESMLYAITTAAERGVDVQLFACEVADQFLVYHAQRSYYETLLRAGVRCYAYEAGFLHAKGITVDGCVSCYGTANMDIRSFQLNFEVNAILYDEETTARLEESFLRDLAHCREITEREYAGRNVIVRFREQCCRLLSPLL